MIQQFVSYMQRMNFIEASIVIPAVLGLLVLVLPWLRNKIGWQIAADVSDGLSEGFSAIALFFVFIAAMSLSTLQGYQKDGAKVVEKELSLIASLDRDVVRMHEPEADAVRTALKSYVQKIVDDEWKLLAKGQPSEAVDGALDDMMRAIDSLTVQGERQDALFAGLVERADALAEARNERIEVANQHLEDVYWGMIFSFVGLLIVISTFTQVALAKRASLCGKMLAIAFSLVMLIQLDGVFSGDIAVPSSGYVKAIKKMNAVTATLKKPT